MTTRKLAQKAGVNAGLIRYYFINKEGLYKAMIGEMLSGIAKDISKLAQQQQIESIEPVLRSHAKIMQQYPEFPMLMFKELMGEGLCFNFIVEASNRIINPMFDQAISQLVEKGKLRPTIDHTLLRVTVLSVMFHPWLLRKAAPGVDGFELNESMVEKLIKHHTQSIEYGCFVQPDVDCD
ncbi:MAG: TetR/AcrR family transcriptional regulator [Psychrosphaera sp.]|nr:TetR/AcrR family transcriptional regulator [Psychrosphaera sp.]